jgi:hypothetical protein
MYGSRKLRISVSLFSGVMIIGFFGLDWLPEKINYYLVSKELDKLVKFLKKFGDKEHIDNRALENRPSDGLCLPGWYYSQNHAWVL